MSAPFTIIVGYDLKFYGKLPKLFLNNPGMRDVFANNPNSLKRRLSVTRPFRAPT